MIERLIAGFADFGIANLALVATIHRQVDLLEGPRRMGRASPSAGL
jgi:hypothetical protein